jgi:hypothetical protein
MMRYTVVGILSLALSAAAGAFPAAGILDTFNRADETPLSGGGAWTRFDTGTFKNTLSVVSNTLRQTDYRGGAYYWNGATYADVEVYATWVTKNANTKNTEIYVRLDPAAVNGYKLRLTPDTGTDVVTIRRMTGGSSTAVATINQEVASGDSLGFSAVGDILTAWYKPAAGAWSAIGTYDISGDATKYQGAGYVGLSINQDAGTILDDFGGGGYSAPPAFTTYYPTPTLLWSASGGITGETNVQGLTRDAAGDWYWGVNEGVGVDSTIYKLNTSGVTQSSFTSTVEHAAILCTIGDTGKLCVSNAGAAELMDFDGANKVHYDLTGLAGSYQIVFGWISGDTFMVRATAVSGYRVWYKVTLSGGTCTLVTTYTTAYLDSALGRRQGGCWRNGKQYVFQDQNSAASGEKCIDEWTFTDGANTAAITTRWSWTHTQEGEGLHADSQYFYTGFLNKQLYRFEHTSPGTPHGGRRLIVTQ